MSAASDILKCTGQGNMGRRRTGEVAEKGGKCGGETQRKKSAEVNIFNC